MKPSQNSLLVTSFESYAKLQRNKSSSPNAEIFRKKSQLMKMRIKRSSRRSLAVHQHLHTKYYLHNPLAKKEESHAQSFNMTIWSTTSSDFVISIKNEELNQPKLIDPSI